MRVIAGVAKGRKLKTLPGPDLRPTADRVKEALFSKLGPIEGAAVLDLYSGTGSLGIEALSRGAATATFVEQHPAAIGVVRENLESARLSDRATVFKQPVERFLNYKPEAPFDLVLMDPPYRVGFPVAEIGLLTLNGFLAEQATVVVEVSSRSLPVEGPPGLMVRSETRYGDTALVFLGQN